MPLAPLRVLVLGAGGTGGYFGARLAQAAACQVSFLVRPARAAALVKDGLRVQTPTQRFEVPHGKFSTVVDASTAEAPDLVVVSCKAYDLDSAIKSISPCISKNPSTLILPILNGVKHFSRLDEVFSPSKVLGGCVYINSELDAQGIIQKSTPLHRIVFGMRPGNSPHATDVLSRLLDAFKHTPVDARLSDNVMQDVWEKFVFTSSMAGMTCLMRAPVGTIASSTEGRELMLRMMEECMLAAKLEGYPMRPHAVQDISSRLTDPESKITASMLKDLLAGRQIESDQLVGDMLAKLRKDSVASGVMLQAALCHLESYNMLRSAKM